MKVLLALICFIGMLLHSLFGYFLYVKGENIFYPEQKQIQILNKTATALLQKVPDTIEVPAVENTEAKENKTDVPKVEMLSKSSSTVAESEPSLQITDTYQAPEPTMKHPEFITGWAGFLQVENAVMTFILFLLGFSICCINGRGTASRWVFGFNLVFWSTLSGAVWFFHPTNTPLNILRLTFNFPEWYFVLAASGLAALLSFILYVNAFRAPIDKKKKVEEAKEPAMKKEVLKDEKKSVDPKADTSLKTAPEVKNLEEPKQKKGFGFGFDRFTKKTDKEVTPVVKKDTISEIKSKEKTENNSELKTEFKSVKEEIKEKGANIKTSFDSFEKPVEKPINNLKENKEQDLKENVKLNNQMTKEDKKPEDNVIILGNASTKNETIKPAEVAEISDPIIPKNELNK